jgi:hypothetical protein
MSADRSPTNVGSQMERNMATRNWNYCKLVDGREMVVWSDNTDTETYDVFPVSELEYFDAEYLSTIEVPYADVVRTDHNRIVAYL